MSSRIHPGIEACPRRAAVPFGGGQTAAEPAAATTPAAGAAASAPEPLPGNSTITGHIKFEGTAEKPRVIRMASDPICGREGQNVTSEVLVVGPANELQNVFVYV